MLWRFRIRDYNFHLLSGTSVKVPFMASEGKHLISAFDGFKVVGLPYEQGNDDKRQFSMYIFLPDANDGLPALVEHVTSEPRFLECHLPYQKVEVGDFRIPKFKISFGLNIYDVVKEMRLALPFSLRNAQFTKMVDSLTDQENLYVSNIIHKSFIEVDEAGTKAATVTSMMFFGGGPPTYSKVIDFVADHSFLFVIREDSTGTVLFIGQTLHPLYDK
ncbi:serpin-ZX-like [Lotus japonicus]|uniref:serpin-ZX-like n=1 Tax=Lotus japonicus TaxID=34305 RepID=UPI002588C45A|nr:serpin-ZX-like [Lotus japonicus]